MAGDGHPQLTSVLQRTGRALAMLNPVRVVLAARTMLREIGSPPPGDPPALRALSVALRSVADAAQPLAAGIPAAPAEAAEAGEAGEAGEAAQAVARAVGVTAPAVRAAAAALDALAERIDQQQGAHREQRNELRAALRAVDRVRRQPGARMRALSPTSLAGLIRGCRAAHTSAVVAADRAAGVFAQVAGAARVGAAAAGGFEPAEGAVLAALGVRPGGAPGSFGDPGGDGGLLTVAQLVRAGQRLGALPAPQAAEVRGMLASAASAVERGYLLKAVAAGHCAADLAAFAAAVRGRDEPWLHHHLTLVDRGGPGAQDRFGAEVDQCDGYTCGTTSAIVALSEADPAYTLSLTTGLEPPYDQADRAEFDRRLTAEQHRVHRTTNAMWPQRLGTLPAAIAAWLNHRAGATGVRYRWHPVDDGDRRAVSGALREVVTAVAGGRPVPILVGAAVPRHYVLAVGVLAATGPPAGADPDLVVFEPTSGDTMRVTAAEFLGGHLGDRLGFDHVQAVIVPVEAAIPPHR